MEFSSSNGGKNIPNIEGKLAPIQKATYTIAPPYPTISAGNISILYKGKADPWIP